MQNVSMRRARLGLGVSIALSSLAGAHAATIQVNNASGGCSLAQAITAANSDSPVGECASGAGADLILLPELAHYPNFSTGGPSRITSDVTIRGHAFGTSEISCEGGGQPLFIGDETSAPTVVLERFAISYCQFSAGAGAAGGGGAAGMGGAVFVYDGDVTLRSVLIRFSAVTGAAGGSVVFSGNGGGGGGGMRGAGADAGAASTAQLSLGSGGGGGANPSSDSVLPGGSAGAPNGGTGGGAVLLPTAGGFGGGGGGGASLIGDQGGQGGASGGFGGGGGGGASTSAASGLNVATFAGGGGDGGFGGGGGRGGSSLYASSGHGGGGGFGGAGGARGYSEQGPGLEGAPGFGALPANTNTGGHGAALGGALFVRAGVVTITDSSFANNSALSTAAKLGGAIFVLDQAARDAHNAITGASGQGMPQTLPVLGGCSVSFSGNSAASQTGTDSNNHDVYGSSRATLVEPCIDLFANGYE